MLEPTNASSQSWLPTPPRATWPTSEEHTSNPYIKWRKFLWSWHYAIDKGWTDEDYISLVAEIDKAISAIDGSGFRTTPTGIWMGASDALPNFCLWKDETNNVAGSHKARHLFGVALHLAVAEDTKETQPLAIASCGNAAIAAAIVAKAINRPIEVFVPTWAEKSALATLQNLGAQIQVCESNPSTLGDPCYTRFMAQVQRGSQPFGVQGINTPSTFDGGRTLGWELRDQVDNLERVFVQVGGGALGTATGRALPNVALYPVQVAGCAPLKRAWDLLAPKFDLEKGRANPEEFMWPWDQPSSAASGLLDDVTYDWLPFCLLYTSPSPRDGLLSRMPSSA